MITTFAKVCRDAASNSRAEESTKTNRRDRVAHAKWYNSSTMVKQKKKRNKSYTGADAALTRPVITRVTAANRGKIGQWWFEHKRVMKPVLITSLVVIIIGWLIFELVRIVSGA